MLATAIAITAAMLAVLAGVAKLARPHDAVLAMQAVGLPSGEALVRAGSLAECCIGVAALASASWIPRALLAVSFAALAAFVAASMRSGSEAPCGCFGGRGATSNRRHLAINLACALGAGAAALRGGAPLRSVHATTPTGLAVLALGAASALLAATFASRARTA